MDKEAERRIWEIAQQYSRQTAEQVQAIEQMQKKYGELLELVQEYQRLVNSYHECYPYPSDLTPFKDELEQRAKPFLEENEPVEPLQS